MSVSLENNILVRWFQRTPDRQRRRIGLSLLVVCFVFLLSRSFLAQQGVVKTALQVEFENYVEIREHEALLGKPTELVIPRVHVSIQSGSDFVNRELMIDPAEGDDSASRILRILALARESKVFGLNRGDISRGQAINLRIEDGEHEYVTAFLRSDIEHNIQAELLLKLLTIHGKQKT